MSCVERRGEERRGGGKWALERGEVTSGEEQGGEEEERKKEGWHESGAAYELLEALQRLLRYFRETAAQHVDCFHVEVPMTEGGNQDLLSDVLSGVCRLEWRWVGRGRGRGR